MCTIFYDYGTVIDINGFVPFSMLFFSKSSSQAMATLRQRYRCPAKAPQNAAEIEPIATTEGLLDVS